MSTKVIGTHSGSFHCDEALACAMLQHTAQFQDATIVRTRDEEELKKCDIVVDVGAQYLPDQLRFDHHQRGFFATLNDNYKTKLSSAGLIYKHFGKEVVANVLKCKDAATVDLLYYKLYENLIESVDGIDNGISQYEGDDIKQNYKVRTDLSSRVGYLNPGWNEENPDRDALFLKAVALVKGEFESMLSSLYTSWLPARAIVEEGMKARKELSSPSLLLLPRFCPWKAHLYDIEKEMGIENEILYVIFEDSAKTWRVQCVSQSASSFANRRSLPEAWRGKRNEELDQVAALGFPGCIFVHAAGFIGGHKTKEGAIKMAEVALTIE